MPSTYNVMEIESGFAVPPKNPPPGTGKAPSVPVWAGYKMGLHVLSEGEVDPFNLPLCREVNPLDDELKKRPLLI